MMAEQTVIKLNSSKDPIKDFDFARPHNIGAGFMLFCLMAKAATANTAHANLDN